MEASTMIAGFYLSSCIVAVFFLTTGFCFFMFEIITKSANRTILDNEKRKNLKKWYDNGRI